MAEIPVSLTDRKLEPHVPENNSVETKGNKIFYKLSKSTRPSKIAREGERSERSLDERARRADIYKEVLKTPDRARRKELLAEAHARDEIEAQYLAQGEIRVNIPGLGDQMARYTMIEPPEGRKLPEEHEPIFLIPGISNDLDSVGSLAKEIPYQGRSLVVVGMPDSQMGNATEQFAQAVKESPTLEPHVDFFKAAINKLVGEDAPVELWGMSAGSMIVAEMLNDPVYSERVNQAVLLSPAGTSEMTMNQQNLGVLNETIRVYGSKKGVNYPLYLGNNKEQKAPETAGKTFNILRKKLLKKFEPYKTMKIKEGGQITVVTGRHDGLTRSTDSNDMFRTLPQVELISLKNGIHNTPIIEADKVVAKVLDRQKLADVRAELG